VKTESYELSSATAALSHVLANGWPPYCFPSASPSTSAIFFADSSGCISGTGSAAACQSLPSFWGGTPPLESPTSPTMSCCSVTPGGGAVLNWPCHFNDQPCQSVDRCHSTCFNVCSSTSRLSRSRSRSRSPRNRTAISDKIRGQSRDQNCDVTS